MAISKEERRKLLATKRPTSRAKVIARVWFAVLALNSCAVALVPYLYIS